MLLPPVPLRQRDRVELLDEGAGSLAEVRRSLHDIRRINKWLGGAPLLRAAVFDLLQKRRLTHATLLDIGTGSADLPLMLRREAARRGLALRILALDLSARHLQVAREDLHREKATGIHLLRADAFHLPFAGNSIDIVTASLFLHHFRAPQIHALLGEFQRVARVGFVASDLVRDAVPLWFFRLARPVFARSYLTRFDGEASLRRAYTRDELQDIAETGWHGATVTEHFPYRLAVVGEK